MFSNFFGPGAPVKYKITNRTVNFTLQILTIFSKYVEDMADDAM